VSFDFRHIKELTHFGAPRCISVIELGLASAKPWVQSSAPKFSLMYFKLILENREVADYIKFTSPPFKTIHSKLIVK
jgi:hypothetical protein